jgi:hypothetical protein
MTAVQVIAMGQFKPFYVENIDRPHHGMHRILVAEILIEFAIAALVVMGAGSKINAPFHVVQTGLLPGRQLAQAIFPENDPAPPAGRSLTLLQMLLVFTRHAPQGPVKPTGLAMIVGLAIFAPNHPGLLPDAGMLSGGIFADQLF